MAYEIPLNLRYREKILFGLTFQQLFWVGLFGGLAVLFFFKGRFPLELRVVVSVFLTGLALGFAFFGLDVLLKNFLVYKASINEAGFFDPKIKRFVSVHAVDNDLVFLSDSSVRAVLQVQPINFNILSDVEKRAVIQSYKKFLNSLDFPIQVVMRTVNLNLDGYLDSVQRKAGATKNSRVVEQAESFKAFFNKFLKDRAVRNRLFYLVVPFDAGQEINYLREAGILLKNFFSKKKQKTQGQLLHENLLNQVNIRVKLCEEKLRACGLKTRQLNSNELVSLLASFFEGFVEVDNKYLFPLTLYGQYREVQESVQGQ